MSIGTQVLSGARDRLLPAAVPFSFFAAACVFHVLGWAALLRAAPLVPGYRGGPGEVLASIHLFTLGVLAATAMGAALQLLPVATRVPIWRVWPARLSFAAMVPGVALLAWGMEGPHQWALEAGGGLCAAALAIFALLVGVNLARARGLPVVIAHGWAALAALVGLVALGLTLIGNYAAGYLANPAELALAHMTLAVFGFMSMLALGFSHILIPMFALSRALPARGAWAQFALAALAVAVAAAAALVGSGPGLVLAAAIGIGAGAAYFRLMQLALRTRMRKRLGLAFVLVRVAWGCLGLSLALALAQAAGLTLPGGPTLMWFLALGGWLVTFLMAVLQRIMPFLATMHAAGKGGRPPLVSELSSAPALRLHAGLHLAALALIALAIVLDNATLARLGAGAGLAGAIAFAAFALRVFAGLRRIARGG
ncbi:MAG: hypothetical protein Kow0058_13480 [Roseovarius sp.]